MNGIGLTASFLSKTVYAFCRINERRKNWITEIQSYQTIEIGAKKIYICDLHFDRHDLVRNGNTFRLKDNNVLPKFR